MIKLLFLLITTIFSVPKIIAKPFLNKQPKLSNTTIKVLLPSPSPFNKKHNAYKFDVSSSNGLKFWISENPKRKIAIKEKNISLECSPSGIFIHRKGRKKIKLRCKWVSLSPIKDELSVNGTSYEGTITIHYAKKRTPQVVNSLEIDDYVYSVLRYEIFQSWPLEVQRVQAITSRTYAIYQMLQARRKKQIYDIKNNNFHQTYKGSHNFSHLREAVESTKNIIITYKNNVALAMFDACCGGIIPAHMKGIEFESHPYLARKNRCTYCNKNPFYHWTKELKIEDFVNSLKANKSVNKKLQSIGKLKGIKILEKDKAGIVHQVQLVGSKKHAVCSGKNLLDCMREKIRSQNFSLQKIPNQNKIKIIGNGYGHQLGLCQRGAYELVKKGWNFQKILDFYYPGTKLVKFKIVNPSIHFSSH